MLKSGEKSIPDVTNRPPKVRTDSFFKTGLKNTLELARLIVKHPVKTFVITTAVLLASTGSIKAQDLKIRADYRSEGDEKNAIKHGAYLDEGRLYIFDFKKKPVSADMTEHLKKMTGRKDVLSLKESDFTQILTYGGVAYASEHALFMILPNKSESSDEAVIGTAIGSCPILYRVDKPKTNTVVAVTDKELLVVHPLYMHGLPFAEFLKNIPKNLKAETDANDPNCVVITSEGKPIIWVHTDSKQLDGLVKVSEEVLSVSSR